MGRWWAAARVLGGAAILAVLVWRLGTGPFRQGVHTVDVRSVVAVAAIALVTTVGCAWRWSLVARGLGVAVPLPAAVAAYYRSQFLNTTLPGGVLGDVHRAVSHGRRVGDVGRGLRAVAWERSAGQVVQAVLAVIVLVALPSPVRGAVPVVALVLVSVGLAGVLVVRVLPHSGASRRARAVRAAGADLREGVLARRVWPGVVLASTVVVAGHVATFVIAARVAGVTVPLPRLLPLVLLVLLATGVPVNVGGWGPREGVAAWVFGAAGLGADSGLATAVAYGVLVLVACLPGAGVLVVGWLLRLSRSRLSRATLSRAEPDPAQPPMPHAGPGVAGVVPAAPHGPPVAIHGLPLAVHGVPVAATAVPMHAGEGAARG